MSEAVMSEVAGRDAFEQAAAVQYREVSVPVVGAVRLRSVRTSDVVRVMGLETQMYQARIDQREQDAARLSLEVQRAKIALAVVDAEGAAVFSESDPVLEQLPLGIVQRLVRAIDAHWGYEDLEETAKNSSATGGGSSSTD